MIDNLPRRPITVCFPLAGESLGGSHVSLLGLIEQLDPDSYRVLLVTERADGRIARHFRGFETVLDPAAPRRAFAAGRAFGPLKFLSTLTGLRKRAKFLREHNVAIVHTNDGRSHATWSLAAKFAGARLLWHHRADPDARGLRWLAPLVADRIVSVSRFSLPRKARSLAARAAQVVFSPFDTRVTVDRHAMHAQLMAELDLPDDALICGFFGSFIARKRPLLFIDTVALLQRTLDQPVVGVMFGEAEHPEIEHAMHRSIAAQGLEGCIRLMGFRSPGHDWIASCDVLVVPAIDEPLGRTLVEAMVVGTPVVASSSGGNAEAILPGLGVLVAADDAVALAKGCLQVIADPQATAAMVARAQSDACSRFARERHVALITAIYDELAMVDAKPAHGVEPIQAVRSAI